MGECVYQGATAEGAGIIASDGAIEDTDGGAFSLPLECPLDTAESVRLNFRTTRGNHLTSCTPSHRHHGNVAKSVSVERYVHINRSSVLKHFPTSTRAQLKAKAAVRPPFARFELVDRRDRMEKTLLESDWLPDESELCGEPFFLRQYYHLTNCVGVCGVRGGRGGRERGTEFHVSVSNMSCHREGRCHMLFQLMRVFSSDTTE